jgi:hypothetical protein
MKGWTKIISIFVTLAIVFIFYLVLSSGIYHTKDSIFAQSSSLSLISITNENKLIGNSEFVISPNPFTGTGNYTVIDNSAADTEKDKDGIITLVGIKNGNYSMIQTRTASGFSVDQIQKTVQVNNSSAVATFTDLSTTNTAMPESSTKSVSYSTKFECGSIYAGEGPLRPGHYDTDISLFNKQRFPTQVFWNTVPNNGTSSNAILLKMESETSKSITCHDIRNILGNNNDNFVEGFTIINVPLDSMLNSGTIITNPSLADINILDVQVFYTANALDMLPHEMIVDKISFYIIQDYTGKIPKELLRKTLDVSVPSTLNEISDTDVKVKKIMEKQYNLTEYDLPKIVIKIKSVSVGVGVFIDDHAISLSTIKPEISS